MAEYVQAESDRQRREAIGRLLCRAIEYFPPETLTVGDRVQAIALAAQATSSVQPAVSEPPPGRETNEQRPERMLARLAPRQAALTAFLQLEMILVPHLISWRQQIERRQAAFLGVEDTLSEAPDCTAAVPVPGLR